MNRVQLIGNVGKEIQHGLDRNNKAWAKFSLATQKKNREEYITTWHSIVAFGYLAENIIETCKKGSMLYVGGALNNNKYEKDGQTINRVQVVATEVYLMLRLRKEEITDEQSAALALEGDPNDEEYF